MHLPPLERTAETTRSAISDDVGDTVLLGARSGACTCGLAWSARNALSYDYSLDGEPLPFDFVWDRPVAVPISLGSDESPSPEESR